MLTCIYLNFGIHETRNEYLDTNMYSKMCRGMQTWILVWMYVSRPGHCCYSLQWRHNGRNGVSNHQPHDCLLNGLFRRRSKKAPKLRVTCLCAGNSPVTGEFHAQMASNVENVSIWWRRHVFVKKLHNTYTSVLLARDHITRNRVLVHHQNSAINWKPGGLKDTKLSSALLWGTLFLWGVLVNIQLILG